MTERPEQLLRHVGRLVSRWEGETDAGLLERFVRSRDESAFAELVTRHAAMVLGVCRRILRDDHQAEDALQATFLVLARKAATVRPATSLAAWLHAVARQLALKYQRRERCRRQREAESARAGNSAPPRDLLDELSARELLLILDEELQRLPKAYRVPLILCALESRTVDAAARLLGCSPSSVRGRLVRGRARLHARLKRRGVFLPAGVVAALLAPRAGTATVPATLVAAAVRVVSPGREAAPRVAALAAEWVKPMTWAPRKVGLLLLLLAAGAVAGLGPRAHPVPAGEQPAVKLVAGPEPVVPGAEKGEPARTDRFGDALPPGAVARMGTLRWRYLGGMNAVVFSPDGTVAIAAGEDQTIRLWERATGKEVRRLTGHRGGVTGLALSRDGKTLASAGREQTVLLWDLPTGKERGRCVGHQGEVLSVVFSPDGEAVLSGAEDNTIRLWDARTGKEVRRFEGSKRGVACLALSPDGKTLASATAERGLPVRLWDVGTGKETRQLSVPDGVVTSVAFAPDGKTLAAAGGELDQAGTGPVPTIRLWDTATGTEVKRWVLRGTQVQRVAFAPDGRTLAAVVFSTLKADLAPNFTVRLLDADTGAEVHRLGTFFFKVSCLAFSADGKTLAAGGSNKILSLWDVATGRALHQEGSHQGDVTSLAFAPDGETLFSASYDTTVRAWRVLTGEETRRFVGHEGLVRCLAVSPGGKVLVSGGGTLSNTREKTLRLWDVSTGKERAWVHKGPGLVSGVAFSADGKTVVSTSALLNPGTKGRLIQLWGIDGGAPLASFPLPAQGGYAIALSPDRKTLAAAGARNDHAIRLWDTAAGKECGRCQGHEAEVLALAFSPDGKSLASAGQDRTIRIWETRTGKQRQQLPAQPDAIHAVVFAANGMRLASGGTDRTIRLWDLPTGEQVCQWTGHLSGIKALALSPDGTKLASGSSDTTILIWDLKSRLTSKPPPAVGLARKKLEDLWADLAAEDAGLAQRAIWALTAAAEQAVPLLQERLQPAPPPDPQRIARLIDDLGSDQFAVREKATDDLRSLGAVAGPALRKALKGNPSLEVRRRLERLVGLVEGAGLPAEVPRALRAIEVLEHAGTPRAREVLQALVKAELWSTVTHEAEEALQRLSRQPAAKP